MGLMLKVALLALAGYLIYRAARNALTGGGRSHSRFQCATCRNCRALFDDGVICAFGRRETFKNETHIANCHDYQRGRAG